MTHCEIRKMDCDTVDSRFGVPVAEGAYSMITNLAQLLGLQGPTGISWVGLRLVNNS